MPQSFILQWHVTERCNRHCRHCYQENDRRYKEEPIQKLLPIIEQYAYIIRRWKIPKAKARIHIAGGEPLLRTDFFELAERLHDYTQEFKWGILSNGSLINGKVAKRLKDLGMYSCQLSIEGCEQTNDSIRGGGSFKTVLKAIKFLLAQEIKVRLSMTLNKHNVKDAPELANMFKDMGVSYLSTRRLVPIGQAENLLDSMLSSDELFSYYKWVELKNRQFIGEKQKLRIQIGCDSGVSGLVNKRKRVTAKNFCGIVNGRILVVMPNGDVMPCRRLPIVMGNAFHSSLYKIWKSSKMQKIRSIDNLSEKCKACNNLMNCYGGAKCITYAVTGNPLAPDLACKEIG